MASGEEKQASDRTELLRVIRDEVINLIDSPLYRYRTENKYFPVLGQGSHEAKIMFIGEAPGRNEAMTGRPFCGAAGKILDELLKSIGLAREEVYVTNIVKDRPPENRDPTPEEITVYAPFLDRQLETLKPRVIATLGRYSMQYIMAKAGLGHELKPISALHGKEFEGELPYGEVHIIPLYHPAAAIYTRANLPTHFKDFEALKKYL